MNKIFITNPLSFCLILFLLSGCATVADKSVGYSEPEDLASDREAILAMAGDYKVTFDFEETVSFQPGYKVKESYTTGAQEIVRVIEDKPGFISLQHILLVGGEDKFPIKHWRQDWVYEPAQTLDFVGFNRWETRKLSASARSGKWAQFVYQVDDGPRYSGVGEWRHEQGVSSWTSEPSLRPLPRRDMTKRDDYDAILAVNRHALTPSGWVHEQDNTKLILRDNKQLALAREVGVNTYIATDDINSEVAETYWESTKLYWAAVRDYWLALSDNNSGFSLTMQGEPVALYTPLLDFASKVKSGEMPIDVAKENARKTIAEYTTTNSGSRENLAGVSSEHQY